MSLVRFFAKKKTRGEGEGKRRWTDGEERLGEVEQVGEQGKTRGIENTRGETFAAVVDSCVCAE